MRWLEAWIGPDDVLWDIGANVGGYSLIAASIGAGTVVAVEPSYANFAALCDNVALNGRASTVTALPLVLGSRTSLVALDHQDRRPGATHRVVSDSGQPVLGFALDDLIGQFDLAPPTLIKLDVDGAEVEVLAGARHALGDPRLRSILIEIEEANAHDVVRLVEAAGLELRERHCERDGLSLRGVWYGIFSRARP